AGDKSELRTEFARPPPRHPASDPEGLGFIRSGKHNPATNGNRPAEQRWVEQLLDRGVEGVQVRMEDSGYRFHPNGSLPRFPELPVSVCELSAAFNIGRTFAPIVKPRARNRAQFTQCGHLG